MDKRLLTLMLAFTVLIACSPATLNSIAAQTEPTATSDFVPTTLYPAPTVTHYKNGVSTTEPWSSLCNEEIRRLLPNQKSHMSLAKVDAKGSVSYMAGNATMEVGDYRLITDYVKYKVEDVPQLGTCRVGVGLRMTANIHTKQANIDLASLFGIGIAAKQGYLDGDLTVETIGMDSTEISTLFPTPSKIDETGIQKALEALAAIKSKMSDTNTILTPQIVAVKTLPASAITNGNIYPKVIKGISELLKTKPFVYTDRETTLKFSEVNPGQELLIEAEQRTVVHNPSMEKLSEPFRIAVASEKFVSLEVFEYDAQKNIEGPVMWKKSQFEYDNMPKESIGSATIVNVGQLEISAQGSVLVVLKFTVAKSLNSDLPVLTSRVLTDKFKLVIDHTTVKQNLAFGVQEVGLPGISLDTKNSGPSKIIYTLNGLQLPGHGMIVTWQAK